MEAKQAKGRSEFEPKLTPYCTVGEATLYQGDVLRIAPALPAGLAAAVITDPPYSSGGLGAATRAADPKAKYCHGGNDCGRPTFSGDNRDQRSFGFWSTLWMIEATRLLQEGGYCLAFSDWRQLPILTDVLQAGGLIWRGVIAWDKGRGARAPHKGYFRHQCEYLAWGTHGPCRNRPVIGPLDGCYHESVKKSDKHHMTGKPTPLMRELVKCVDPGELVVDFFNGSGTTGAACLLEGRRFVGIELSEAYCEITAKRWERLVAGDETAAAA